MYEDQMALFSGIPGAFDLYLALETWILAQCPGAQIRPKKSQVGFFDGCGFAWVSRPLRGKTGVNLTLGLPDKLESARIFAAVEAYPGRWTHHIPIFSADEINDELTGWLQSAHAFARARRRR